MSDESELRLRAQIAANTSWANTRDRSARTSKARAALDQRFLDEADGDPDRAESLKKAHFQRMALKSAQSRRRPLEARLLEQKVADWRKSIASIEAQIARAESRLAEIKEEGDES